MESLEPSTDERPMEEGRKGGEAVRAAWTSRRELGRRGGLLAKQSPESGWQKLRGDRKSVV